MVAVCRRCDRIVPHLRKADRGRPHARCGGALEPMTWDDALQRHGPQPGDLRDGRVVQGPVQRVRIGRLAGADVRLTEVAR